MSECTHQRTEVRCKTAVNGAQMFKRQCLDCGKGIGEWIPRGGATANAPPWDDGLQERKRQTLLEHAREQREAKTVQWRRDYNEYLRTPVWASKRDRVLKRDDYQCQACCRARATEVHHLTYERMDFKGGEPLFDLVAICHACHMRPHRRNLPWLSGDDIIRQMERSA